MWLQLLLLAASVLTQSSYTPANADWNKPVEPFRIVGNLYYVGANDVTSYAIATNDGIILIDTGFRETLPLIEANLTKLGLKLADVKLVLAMHAHYDHVGGVADIQTRTKARFLANPADAALYTRGGLQDFAFGDKFHFPPVKADGLLRDGEAITLGGTQLVPHFTPGHTKGATSYTTTIHDGDRDYHVVFASSLTTPDYQLVDNPKYPTIVQDLEGSFAKLRALPCDVFVSEHGGQFDLARKMQQRAADPSPAHNPFVDPDGYRRFIDTAEASLRKNVAEQREQQGKSKPGKPTKE